MHVKKRLRSLYLLIMMVFYDNQNIKVNATNITETNTINIYG